MKKALLLINLSIVTLLLSSCSSSQNTSTPPSPSPSPGQATSPSPGAPPAADTTPNSPPETVAQAPSTEIIPVIIPPGIEPSTNPQQRQASLSTGRRDPFAAIAVKAKVTVLPSEGEKIGGRVPTDGNGKNGKPTPGDKAGGKSPFPTQTKPGGKGGKVLPASPPEPHLAEDVIITGVVELNGIPYAIVQAPEEPFSRYVQSGQYLANGQVLVKRIDMYAGTPSVLLEQYGVQVTKQVGEKSEPEKSETAAFVGNPTIALSGN
jgi:hypothetical protein